jgi:hypothetical protein
MRRQRELQSPKSMIARTLMGQGIGAENAPEALDWMQSGRIDRFESPEGPTQPAPDWYKPEIRSDIARKFAGAQAVQAGEAKSLEDYFQGQTAAGMQTAIAKALAGGDMVQLAQLQNKDPLKQAQSLIAARIASGELTPQVGGARMAASEGKDLYNVDSTGAVLDRFGGGLALDNPLAQSTIGLRGSQAAQAKAAAAENYAQAESARATADLRRRQTQTVGQGGAAPKGYRWVPDATGEMILEAIPGGPADPAIKGPKPMTEAQGKAMLFGSRMQAANEILAGLEGKGVMTPSLTKMAVEEVPLVGGALGMAANVMVASPEQQQVEQAQRDFVNAVLRRESGAVIADSEFKNAAKQYFPQPGDDKNTREQKRKNRELAIRGILTEAGPGAPDITSATGTGPVVAPRGQIQRAPAPVAPSGQRNIVVNW